MLDFYPTLCEMTGLNGRRQLDGTEHRPATPRSAAAREKPAFSVLRRGKQWGRSVYTEQFRYTEWGDNGAKGLELYDHRSDPRGGISICARRIAVGHGKGSSSRFSIAR
jgi:uncharacterized sulfatase